MSSLLIAITCLGMVLVTEVAVAFAWVIKEMHWLRNVLVPWMVAIYKEIKGKQQ